MTKEFVVRPGCVVTRRGKTWTEGQVIDDASAYPGWLKSYIDANRVEGREVPDAPTVEEAAAPAVEASAASEEEDAPTEKPATTRSRPRRPSR